MVARKSKSALDSRKPGEGLSFTEKMIIIADYEENGLRQCQLVKKYGLSKSFVCRIIKNREEIKTAVREKSATYNFNN